MGLVEMAKSLEPAELTAKGIAPIKKCYLQEAQTRLIIDTVTSIANTGTMVEDSKSVEKTANKPSKKQLKLQRQQTVQFCSNYGMNKCSYGEKCKFSHDVSQYIASKPGDLPGSCPFSKMKEQCPHGITCRWATCHTATSSDSVPESMLHASSDAAQARTKVRDQLATLCTKLASRQAVRSCEEAEENGKHGDQQAANGDVASKSVTNIRSVSQAGHTYRHELADFELRPQAHFEPTQNVVVSQAQQLLRAKKGLFATADAVATRIDARGCSKKAGPWNKKKGGKGDAQVDAGQGHDCEVAQTNGASESADQTVAASDALPQSSEPAQQQMESPPPKRQKTEHGTHSEAPIDATAAHPPTPALPAPARDTIKKKIDFTGQLYLAPLTTVGNLPYRRVCVDYGVDITCGEMAVAANLLQGRGSEWALLKRHPSERVFGVQLAGGWIDTMARTCHMLNICDLNIDFVDLNCGCPIDLIVNKGAGSALLTRQDKLVNMVKAMDTILECPLTVKARKGFFDKNDNLHVIAPRLAAAGACALTVHGRTRQQRYTRKADWSYISEVAGALAGTGCQLIGNGDIVSFSDWNRHYQSGDDSSRVVAQGGSTGRAHGAAGGGVGDHARVTRDQLLEQHANTVALTQQHAAQNSGAYNDVADGANGGAPGGTGLATCMLARGALIKPWVFHEIKSQQHWDISATERLDMLKDFASYGLTHWGSDVRGVETTRRFLLEWLSYTHRYVPVGLLEVLPQELQWRPPSWAGRSWLESLLGSDNAADWVAISEMLLGPVPAGFTFTPKHKSNAYSVEQ